MFSDPSYGRVAQNSLHAFLFLFYNCWSSNSMFSNPSRGRVTQDSLDSLLFFSISLMQDSTSIFSFAVKLWNSLPYSDLPPSYTIDYEECSIKESKNNLTMCIFYDFPTFLFHCSNQCFFSSLIIILVLIRLKRFHILMLSTKLAIVLPF